MPSAHATLWFLGTFVLLWAGSLVVRGLRGSRAPGAGACPACAKPVVARDSLRCSACGFEARNHREFARRRRQWGLTILGVTLAPAGLATMYAGQVVWAWVHPGRGPEPPGFTVWHSIASAVLVFGLILIGWAIRGDRSRGRARCPRCWYDMVGGGLRCPECGREARHRQDLYRPRRRWRAAAAASLLLILAAGLTGVPRVQRGGWRAAVPTTALIAALPWLPAAMLNEGDPNSAEDWTLEGRADTLWRWQERWLSARALGVLEHSESPRHLAAALALSDLAIDAPLRSSILVRAVRGLNSPDPDTRFAAALCTHALMGSGTADRPATALVPLLPELEAVVADASQRNDVCLAAAWAISIAGPEAERALPTILAAAGRGGRMRGYSFSTAIANLLRLGPGAREVVMSAAEGPNIGTAEAAIYAMREAAIVDPVIRGRLLGIVRDGDDARALKAAWALTRGGTGADLAETVPTILEQAEGPRPARAEFVETLSLVREGFIPFMPRIMNLLSDPDPAVRLAAIQTIDRFNSLDGFSLNRSLAWPLIAGLRNDPDPKVAAAALTVVGPGDESAP